MFYFKQIKLSTLMSISFGFGLFLAISLPGLLPSIFYRILFSVQMVFFLSSRFKQISLNFQNKSTGTLSPITLLLSWGGNLARLITLIVDLGFSDLQIIIFNIGYFLCNLIPFAQWIIYYKNKPLTSTKKNTEPTREKESVVKLRKNKKTKENQSTGKSEEVVQTRKKSRKRVNN